MGAGLLTVDQREGGSYKVFVMAVTGDTIIDRSFPFDPVPIPQSAIDSALAESINRYAKARAI